MKQIRCCLVLVGGALCAGTALAGLTPQQKCQKAKLKARFACVLAILGAAFVAAPVAQAANTNPVPPKDYYLALGDSLAYGYQQAPFLTEYPNIDPSTFSGYVEDFAALLGEPGIVTVNDGCPGETSDSLINGGPSPGTCATGAGFPYAWLHHPYTGSSQLDDAVAFLEAHPRQTSPVTIDIGANDLLYVVQVVCNGNPTCIQTLAPTAINHVKDNLITILTTLAAVVPKGTNLIVMGLYNPLFTISGSDYLVENVFNPTMAAVASSFGARFADPFPVINGNEPTSVCTLTNVCGPLHDIHPNAAGYQAIANVIFGASGYH